MHVRINIVFVLKINIFLQTLSTHWINLLSDWVGLGLIENWVGWVGIGLFFCGFEWVEHMC